MMLLLLASIFFKTSRKSVDFAQQALLPGFDRDLNTILAYWPLENYSTNHYLHALSEWEKELGSESTTSDMTLLL